MSSGLEEFNKLLMDEMKRAYSEKAMEYATNPVNIGPMQDANGYASVADSHGDELALWLKVEDNVIKKATYFTKGCLTIKIAAGAITEMVTGKTLEDAMEITPKELREFIGKTPRKTWHCTVLAVDTLHEAIRNQVIMKAFGSEGNKVLKIDL